MSDSDSESDQDYIPTEGEAVSEEEESGDDESWVKKDEGDDAVVLTAGVKRKRVKIPGHMKQRKRKGGIKLEEEVPESNEVVDEENERLKKDIIGEKCTVKEEKEELRKQDLWSSFLSDVGQRPMKSTGTSTPGSQSNLTKTSGLPACISRPPEKVSVTKTYTFAGEEIEVTEKVDANSKKGKEELMRLETTDSETMTSTTMATTSAPERVSCVNASSLLAEKKPAGLNSVLDKLNTPAKISCLDKSKMDWDLFKKNKGLEEELTTHNKGRQGYIERLDFLGRTDKRQFEIERDLRQSTRTYLP